MARTHVSFRLTDDALFVIHQVQLAQHLPDRTDALETILKDYWHTKNKTISKLLEPVIKTLEAFTHAET